MFDNNDFLNSYKKSLEEDNPRSDRGPAEEEPAAGAAAVPESAEASMPEQAAQNSAGAQQGMPGEAAAGSDQDSVPADGEKSKFVWGSAKPSQSSAGEKAQDSAGAPEEAAKPVQPKAELKADIAQVEQALSAGAALQTDGVESAAATGEQRKAEGLTFEIPQKQTVAPPVQAAARTAPSKTYEEKSKFVKPEPQHHERRYYDGYEPPRKPVLRNIIIAAACVLALILLIVLIASNAGKVEVKDFTGWSRADFMLWASENQVLTQIDEQYNEQVAADKIISQTIPAGEKVKKGDFVRVALSKGPDLSVMLMLPDLMNMTNNQIEQWAAENFMTKVRITTEFSNTVPAGRVIKYEINDNTVLTEVRRDTPIYIYISKGPQDQTSIEVEIPDFKTMGISEAVLFAQANGLSLTIEELYDEYVPENSIISQEPKPKTKAHVGDAIKVIVSLGKKVFMPDFSGLTREQAMTLAGQLGINATFDDRYSSTKEGRFSYQTVEPGVEVTKDTTVTVYYSLGNKIPIVSYVGQQVNQLEQWIESVNAKDAKLTLTKTYTQSSAASGTILQQNKENTFISKGTAITVVVSSGQKIFVPDFVADNNGETAINREMAQQMCQDAGLVPIFVAEAKAGKMSGEIWFQSITPGTEVTQGTLITLKYNPVSGNVVMPNFYGLNETQIKALADYPKLSVTFAAGDTFIPGQEGIAQAQSITAGITVAQGTAVTVKMGPVKVPDFTGMDQAAVTALYPDATKLNITYFGNTGTVSAQTIAPDTLVKMGTAITLTLS